MRPDWSQFLASLSPTRRGDKILVPNTTLLTTPGLAQLLPLSLTLTGSPGATYLGWGYKASGLRAKQLAEKTGGRYILAEEGFLTAGAPGHGALQLLLDTTGGIHYDPAQPSCIDAALDQARQPEIQERAKALIAFLTTHGLSKTNGRPDPDPTTLPSEPFILVCDQVEHDASLAPSRATPARFATMLEVTQRTWPDHLIVVRRHPKAHTGHYASLTSNDRVRVVAGTDHPALWLKTADHVVVISSQMGFEALLHGTPVTCWGTPFYAYRGLTRDFGAQPTYTRAQVDLVTLVGAALIVAPTSFDLLTGAVTTAEEVAHTLLAYRRAVTLGTPPLRLSGFSSRKRRHLHRFIPTLTPTTDQAAPVLSWGQHSGTIRVEDGFLRSKGLGAAFAPPISWVFDTMGGIHTDPTKPSLLEHTLETYPLSDALRARGARLRTRLTTGGYTKYNLTGSPAPYAKGYCLVLGQVEGDASLIHAPLRTNKDLLAAVRTAHPSTFLVYRPHPDVVAGLRPGDTLDYGLADAVDTTSHLPDLLTRASEVHVNTSQGGLEALLLGKPVTCHGPAFYAGWGLTTDYIDFSRRTRRLDIDSLCALLYDVFPLYNDPATGLPITVFQALDLLDRLPTTPVGPMRRRLAQWADSRRRQTTPSA